MRTTTQREHEQKQGLRHRPAPPVHLSAETRRSQRRWLRSVADMLVGATGA